MSALEDKKRGEIKDWMEGGKLKIKAEKKINKRALIDGVSEKVK